MKYYAIIVGGGSGNRMQSDIPKQFILLQGRPLLMYTIESFWNSDFKPAIILVLHVEHHQYWESLCEKFNFKIPHTLVRGGSERFHSVKNGLKAVYGQSVIAVHDAVRPLTPKSVIDFSFRTAEELGNAVTAVRVRDSVRQGNESDSVGLNRNEIYLIQTPQTFRSEILNKAYQQDYRNEFTDDASVVERLGKKINLIEGENRNIKITFPEDIPIAEFYLKTANKNASAE